MDSTEVTGLGCKISITSKAKIRYEGHIVNIETENDTEPVITLANVRSFGTEDRPVEHFKQPRSEVFSNIKFRGADLDDIHIIGSFPEPKEEKQSVLNDDPSIISAPTQNTTIVNDSNSSPWPGSFEPFKQELFNDHTASNQLTNSYNLHNDDSNRYNNNMPNANNLGYNRNRQSGNKKPDMQPSHGGFENSRPNYANATSRYNDPANNRGIDKRPPHQPPAPSFYSGPPVSAGYNYPGNELNKNFDRDRYRWGGRGGSANRGNMDGSGQRGGNYNGYNRQRGRGSWNKHTGIPKPAAHTTKFKDEYDYEQANVQLAEELKKIDIKDKEYASNSSDVVEGSEGSNPDGESFYDQSKSFFDTISSEIIDRANGVTSNNINKREEMRLNSDTFGTVIRNFDRTRGRGYSRGPRGGPGGRGGGFSYSQGGRGNNHGGFNYRGGGQGGGNWRGGNSGYYNNNRRGGAGNSRSNDQMPPAPTNGNTPKGAALQV